MEDQLWLQPIVPLYLGRPAALRTDGPSGRRPLAARPGLNSPPKSQLMELSGAKTNPAQMLLLQKKKKKSLWKSAGINVKLRRDCEHMPANL